MFSDQLNALFDHSARIGCPITQVQLADALNARGHQISHPYISQLRRGKRSNPSPEIVAILADFFGVDKDYFYLPAVNPDFPTASEVIERLDQVTLRRLLAQADGLSDRSMGIVIEMAERLRHAEGCPVVTGNGFWIFWSHPDVPPIESAECGP